MFPPGETPGARKVGVSPGETGSSAEDGCFQDEMNYCVLDDKCQLAGGTLHVYECVIELLL